ncbi:hypothetical protein [Sulfitobacter sp.]|uniref:hypothetical protein n=1 Tax=Sulfitobacter sp. TaxID=1903071 RepID=UPI003F6AF358
MSKSIFLSKTFWVNALTAVVAAIEASGLADVVPAEYQEYVLTALALGNIALRLATYRPVHVK